MRELTLRPRMAFLGWLLPLALAVGAEVPETIARKIADVPYYFDRAEGDGAKTAYQKERCKLDLYLPERQSGFPTLLWFHGGSLQRGDKAGKNAVAIAKRFAGEGIAVATVNYRLHPEVTYPVYIEDAAASFAWVYRNISKHGGDPTRIFVSGHSAGGYLTSMIGLDPRFLRAHGLGTDAIAGLLPVSGQMVTHSTVRKERGLPKTTPVIDRAAPSYHARADAPPLLTICGGEDLPARAAESITRDKKVVWTYKNFELFGNALSNSQVLLEF